MALFLIHGEFLAIVQATSAEIQTKIHTIFNELKRQFLDDGIA